MATVAAAPPRLLTRDVLPLWIGFAALAIPTAVKLAGQEWSSDEGGHQPILIALAGWLMWRQAPALAPVAQPGNGWITALLLALSLPLYAFGRAFDFITLECAGLLGAGVAMLQLRLGLRALRSLWFPLVLFAFAVPAPHVVTDAITAPLKRFVSYVATSGLAAFGLPVARQGVTIFVAQYQLLMEDACSGLNSLEGLVAISMLYVYLVRGAHWGQSLIMASLAIPVAIAANIVRVALLVLITYAFGNEMAQGVFHFAAGIVLFSTALLLMFAIDHALQPLFRVLTRPSRA